MLKQQRPKRVCIGKGSNKSVAQFAVCPTAVPGVANLIWARSHTFVEIDHEINSSHSPPLADLIKVLVCYKQKYVHEVLVCPLVMLALEKWG